jgi:hypothetical protein
MPYASRFLSTACLALLALPAAAQPACGAEELRRHGAVAHRTWTPQFACGEVAGLRISAGLALGLRGSLRTQLDSKVVPAVMLQLDQRSNLSLLAADKRGAMLVWQRSN